MPYPQHIAEAVEVVGPERVLFGSDGPGCNPALELAKVRRLGLDSAAESMILGGNALRLIRVAT
jgi:predicted TIM-barrel fold metal-dependent hydrolase